MESRAIGDFQTFWRFLFLLLLLLLFFFFQWGERGCWGRPFKGVVSIEYI